MRAEDGGPAYGRQLIDDAMRVRRDTEQDILEVQERDDVDEFATLDEGVEDGGTTSALKTPRE